MDTVKEQLVDQLLVMRCQEGDSQALEEIVSRWQRRLWFHAYRLSGSQEAAWDIVQEAWLGILRGLKRLDDPAKFRAWAFRIVTHKAVNWVQSQQSARRMSEPLAAEPPAADSSGEFEAEAAQAMLRRLPLEMRHGAFPEIR